MKFEDYKKLSLAAMIDKLETFLEYEDIGKATKMISYIRIKYFQELKTDHKKDVKLMVLFFILTCCGILFLFEQVGLLIIKLTQ